MYIACHLDESAKNEGVNMKSNFNRFKWDFGVSHLESKKSNWKLPKIRYIATGVNLAVCFCYEFIG